MTSIEESSKVFDSALIKARITLIQEPVLSRSGSAACEWIEKEWIDSLARGFHKIVIRFEENNEEAEATLYVLGGMIIAATMSISGQKIYGEQAWDRVAKLRTHCTAKWVDVYKIPEDILLDIFKDKKIPSLKPVAAKPGQQAPKPAEKREKPKLEAPVSRPPEKPRSAPQAREEWPGPETAREGQRKPIIDLEKEMKNILIDLGFTPIAITIKRERNTCLIDALMEPVTPWLDPEVMLYALFSKYVEAYGYPVRAKLGISFGDYRRELVLEQREDMYAARIAGESIILANKDDVTVKSVTFRATPDGGLEIIFTPTKDSWKIADVEPVFKRVYKQVARYWRGRLVFVIKKGGLFGGSIRIST